MYNLKKCLNKKGFTLVELLVVIAIIGILFVVLVSKVDFAVDKAKLTGVQVTFRSYQAAFESVSRHSNGYHRYGWNTGDKSDNSLWEGKQVVNQPDGVTYTYDNIIKDAADGKRNTYDKGDKNLNGIEEEDETWIGSKISTETWTEIYSMIHPTDPSNFSAFERLERAINSHLDPALHITINSPDENGVITITMANHAVDPWNTEYKGYYISNAQVDGMDSGAIVMYSAGPNGSFGKEHSISKGIVSITKPGDNIAGQDDFALIVYYTKRDGFGMVETQIIGFDTNKGFLPN
jgi:prepilin-type N-terminal cleavage/methylation domain-containing protein